MTEQKHNPEKEYEDLSTNMRHYMTMHFAEMTVLVAITAGLMTLLYTSDPPLSPKLAQLIRLGGILVSIFFWMMEESALYLWGHFARRAAELEPLIGYRQYCTLPGAPGFRKIRLGTWGVRLLCLAILAFWALMFFRKI